MLKLRAVAAPLMALALFASTVAPTAVIAAPAAPSVTISPSQKVHPFLQYGADADPLRVTRVIVQKARKDVRASSLVSTVLGSTLVEEFSVVPAFVLDLPQGMIPLLARSANVR